MDAVAVSRLTKRFGSVTAVDGLSFAVREGNRTVAAGNVGTYAVQLARRVLSTGAPGPSGLGDDPDEDVQTP